MFSTILKAIFHYDINKKHHCLTILGIKLKIPKKNVSEKRRQSPYYIYKKSKADITKIPPATGQIREIQLANLELLKELDYVCKKNKIDYWLDFGSLLGAIRHKGFIPWDDDIDIGMLKKDINLLRDLFNKETRNRDIYAKLVFNFDRQSYLLKIKHKKCQHLFLDIFPYHSLGRVLDGKEQIDLTQEIKKFREKYLCRNKVFDEEILYAKVEKVAQLFVDKFNGKEKFENSDLTWGIEFRHAWKKYVHSYSEIYPLKEIEFENIKFPCVNKYIEHVENIYGNYLAYPKKISLGHTMYVDMTEEEKKVIKELISGEKI